MRKELVTLAIVEATVLVLVGVTWLTGPHLHGTQNVLVWSLAGFAIGAIGSPFVRRWYEEAHRGCPDS